MRPHAIAALSIALSLCVGTAFAAPDAGAAKVDMLLGGTTYAYKTLAPGVWTIDFSGASIGSFKLLAGEDNGILTGFVVVAKAGQFTSSPDLLTALLHLDTMLDTARVGLDADGDLVVETKLSVRTLDGDELKSEFDELASAANTVYEKLGPGLVKR